MRRTTIAVLVVALIVFLGALFNHNPQVARFAKQAAIAQGASGAASSIRVILKEWDVPTPNSHPHDPALAPTARSGTPARDRTPWVDWTP
jgi:hypothetical protein